MSFPIELAAAPIYFAVRTVSSAPTKIVTAGVTIISTFVFLLTRQPSSAAIIAITKTARGPPAPPVTFAAAPTATRLKSTRAGTPIAKPIPIAIAAPTTWPSVAKFPASTKNWKTGLTESLKSCCPSVLMIVPINNEAKSPCAIPLMASIK